MISHSQTASPSAQTSSLWGKSGENWNPTGRLPDFSWAGYHSGDKEIPHVPVTTSVKDFGAKGDGKTDDSDAFIRAVKEAKPGAIFVPAGRYILTKVIEINRSNLVLRGEGPDKTVLYFPTPLLTAGPRQKPSGDWNFNKALSQPELPGATKTGPFKPDGDWRFRGGFVWVEGEDKGHKMAEVTTTAKRGDTTLTLASVQNVKVGQMVRLLQFDDTARSLGRHLHGDLTEAGAQTYNRVTNKFVDWVAQVAAVKGNTVHLDRPLRVDVRPEWKPQIWSYAPTVQEVGLENMTFEFAGDPYPGHLQEHGFNATYFKQCANCWVKNVHTIDADIAFNFEWAVRFSTITDVQCFHKKRPLKIDKTGGAGHHGVQFAYYVQDCLFTRFRFDTHFVHDITVDTLPNGNVFSHGSGLAVNFDHHRGAPYDNLFTDIDLGDPHLAFVSSGQPQNGPRAGAREVFWNVRATGKPGQSLPPPPNEWDSISLAPPALMPPTWPLAVFVGLQGWEQYANWADTALHPHMKGDGKDAVWIEPIYPPALVPQDLHAAQLAHRRTQKPTP